MKLTREQLKSVVKQCLLEILQEGVGGTQSAQQQPQRVVQQQVLHPPQQLRKQFDPRLVTPVKQAKRESAFANMMQSIFADTAKTTLATQAAHGDVDVGGNCAQGPVLQEQFSGTPEQVFGEEAASVWAHLAFADSPSKKST